MTESAALIIGVVCAVSCAALVWFVFSPTLSRRRKERLGIGDEAFGPSSTWDELTDEQLEAVQRYIAGGRRVVFPAAALGLAGMVLISRAYSDFPYVVSAGFLGWAAWMVNERRQGRSPF